MRSRLQLKPGQSAQQIAALKSLHGTGTEPVVLSAEKPTLEPKTAGFTPVLAKGKPA